MLSNEQRDIKFYFENGYLIIEGYGEDGILLPTTQPALWEETASDTLVRDISVHLSSTALPAFHC